MRRSLEDSLDEGTTSRLTLFFSQLNLDAWEVIESTFTSSMAQSHKQKGGKLGRPKKQEIGKKIIGRLIEVSRQNGKRESKRERDEKRRKRKVQLRKEDTSLMWRKKTSQGRLERHDAHLTKFFYLFIKPSIA